MPKIFGIDRINVSRVTNDAHNGRFDLWQRGISRTVAPSSTIYLADRFGLSNGMDSAVNENRITTVPTLIQPIQYALRIQPNATDTTDAGNFLSLQYSMEGHDLTKYRNRKMYIRFYVRSNLAGTWAVSARSSNTDRTYNAPYTINASNTWELKEVIIPFDTVSGGTFNLDATNGVFLWWALATGTNFQGAPNTWLNANTAGVAGMPNFMGSTSNTWDIAGVVMSDQHLHDEEYEMMLNSVSYQEEIERCSRYCQKSYPIDTVPGTINSQASCYKMQISSPLNPWFFVVLPKRMRTTPTMTFYNPTTGTAGQGEIIGSGTFTFASTTDSGEVTVSYNLVGVNSGDFIRWHTLYEAES